MSKKHRKPGSFFPPASLSPSNFSAGPFRQCLLRDFAECVHPGARSYSEIPKSLKNDVYWLGRSLEMTGIWFL